MPTYFIECTKEEFGGEIYAMQAVDVRELLPAAKRQELQPPAVANGREVPSPEGGSSPKWQARREQRALPSCGVVMPVKGVHDQSYANWRAQITSMYGGALEFFFCVESEDDPAYPHVERLMSENPAIRIHLLVAGVCWHC